MTEYRLILQPEAEVDLESAFVWYESKREGVGERFIHAVERAFEQILRAPTAPPVTYRGCRQFAVHRFPYVIHYLVSGECVSIAAVLHARRDPLLWQNRIDDLV
jgi:toxin ParE1/3/4